MSTGDAFHMMMACTCGYRCTCSRTGPSAAACAGHAQYPLATAQWLQVHVFEDKPVVGGACRTEYPFAKAPGLGQSTGAYLLGVMPPELLRKLDVTVPLIRRDPHYFLPTTGDAHLLLGSDTDATRRQFEQFFTLEDFLATTRMQRELEALRDDLAPCWLKVRRLHAPGPVRNESTPAGWRFSLGFSPLCLACARACAFPAVRCFRLRVFPLWRAATRPCATPGLVQCRLWPRELSACAISELCAVRVWTSHAELRALPTALPPQCVHRMARSLPPS